MSKRKIRFDNVARSNARYRKIVDFRRIKTLVGLDISTQKTGVAIYSREVDAIVDAFAWFYGDLEEAEKFVRFFRDLEDLFSRVEYPVLVISEALYLGRSTVAFAKLNQLYGVLKLRAAMSNVTVIFEYPSKIRAQFGIKGNADKEEIITFVNSYLNMHLHFSNVKRYSDDDIADALMLVLFGRSLLLSVV